MQRKRVYESRLKDAGLATEIFVVSQSQKSLILSG